MRVFGKLERMVRQDFFRNLLTLLSGTTLAQAVPLLAMPLLSRLYSPDDFGIASVFLSLSGILAVVSTARYELAIMLPPEDQKASALLHSALIINTLFCVLLMAGALAFGDRLAVLSGEPRLAQWMPYVALSVWLLGCYQCVTYWANRKKVFSGIAWAGVTQSGTGTGIKIGLGLKNASAFGLIWGSVIGQAFALLTGCYVVLKKSPPHLRLPNREQALGLLKKYSVYPKYNLPHAFMNTLSGSFPVFVFTTWFSTEISGLFGFVLTVGFRPLSLFTQSMLQVLSQKIIEAAHQGRDIGVMVKKSVTATARWFAPALLVVGVFAPWLFGLVFGSEWREAGVYLQYLLPWFFMTLLVGPLSFLPEMFFRQKKAMLIDLIYLVLRGGALVLGFLFSDVYLALLLYSVSGILMLSYTLHWYLQLAQQNQAN